MSYSSPEEKRKAESEAQKAAGDAEKNRAKAAEAATQAAMSDPNLSESQKQAILHGLADKEGNVKLDTPISRIEGLAPELIENYNRQVEKYNTEQNIKRSQQMAWEFTNASKINEYQKTKADIEQQQNTLSSLEKTKAAKEQKIRELGQQLANYSKLPDTIDRGPGKWKGGRYVSSDKSSLINQTQTQIAQLKGEIGKIESGITTLRQATSMAEKQKSQIALDSVVKMGGTDSGQTQRKQNVLGSLSDTESAISRGQLVESVIQKAEYEKQRKQYESDFKGFVTGASKAGFITLEKKEPGGLPYQIPIGLALSDMFSSPAGTTYGINPAELQTKMIGFVAEGKKAGFDFLYKKTDKGLEEIPIGKAKEAVKKDPMAEYFFSPATKEFQTIDTKTIPDIISKDPLTKLYGGLRYSEEVEKGNITPRGADWLLYGASRATREFTNIPLSVAEMFGVKTERKETLGSITTEGIITDITEPEPSFQRVGSAKQTPLEYLIKEPAGILDIPSNIALWVSGGKVAELGLKLFKKYNPIAFQEGKITVKPTTKTITKPTQITPASRELTSPLKNLATKTITKEEGIKVFEKPSTTTLPSQITRPSEELGTIKVTTLEGKVIESGIKPLEPIVSLGKVEAVKPIDELISTSKPAKLSFATKLLVTPATKTAELIARGLNIRNVVPEGISGVKGFGQIIAQRIKPKIVYHGTTQESASRILRKGFDPKRGEASQFGGGIFVSSSKSEARYYGESLLKFTLNPKAKILDLRDYLATNLPKSKVGIEVMKEVDSKIAKLKGYNAFIQNRILGKVASKTGYDVVLSPYANESIIFNPKIIMKIGSNIKNNSTIIKQTPQLKPVTTIEQIAQERLGELKYEIAKSASSRGQYIGGTSAIELQLPKGLFRQAKDVDVYIKSSGDVLADIKAVKAEGKKLLKVVQEYDKKLGIDRDLGYNFLEIEGQKGKGLFFVKDLTKDKIIFEVMTRGASKNPRFVDKIIKLGGIRARQAEQVIRDKSQLIRVAKKGIETIPEEKLIKAKKDVDIFRMAKSIQKAERATVLEYPILRPSLTGKVLPKQIPQLIKGTKFLSDQPQIKTVWKGLTFRDKPILGIQEGKLVRGYDPKKVAKSLLNIDIEATPGRGGFEAALGTGIEKELFYSEKTLSELVKQGIIPPIAKERSLAAKKLIEVTKGVKGYVGGFGELPIKDMTQRQADYSLKFIAGEQKVGTVDLVHGSGALRPQIRPEIKEKAGSSLLLGDIDVVPKGKDIEKVASQLIKKYEKGFPLEKGQTLRIGGGIGSNRQIILEESGKENRKIFEVVIKEPEEAGSGITKGEKILAEKIPFKKSVTAKDIPIKLHTARFQQLTNIKQVLAFQKGVKTPLDIYTDPGRTKDIVRSYWKAKSDVGTIKVRGKEPSPQIQPLNTFEEFGMALRESGVGSIIDELGYGDSMIPFLTPSLTYPVKGISGIIKPSKGEIINIQAEKFRSLYPGIEFTDVKPEKILLYSSIKESVPETNRIIKGLGSGIIQTPKIKEPPSSITSSSISRLATKSPYSSAYRGPATKSAYKSLYKTDSVISSKSQSLSSRTNNVTDSLIGSKKPSVKIESKIDSFGSKSASTSSLFDSMFGSGKPSDRPSIKSSSSLGPSLSKISTVSSPPSKGPPSKTPSLTPSKGPPSKPPFSLLTPPPTILIPPPPKEPPVIVPLVWKTRKDKPSKDPYKDKVDFLGGTHAATLLGWRTTKKDIDYGPKTAGLYSRDIALTMRMEGKGKFVKTKKLSILSKPQRFFTMNPKKARKTKLF